MIYSNKVYYQENLTHLFYMGSLYRINVILLVQSLSVENSFILLSLSIIEHPGIIVIAVFIFIS